MSANSERRKQFESLIGHSFADPQLLDMALTHASVPNNPNNNERLEFLGDRVFGLAVAEMLYKAFPSEREGDIAKRHAALVSQGALVGIAEALQVGSHLKLSAGEAKAGGERKDTILSGALEAVIGAIYLDAGLAPAVAFVEKHWKKLVAHSATPPEDPKTRLQEWAQAKGLPLPAYKEISRTGADHSPVFEMEVTVEGLGAFAASATSKRQAEKDAAQKMLDKIGGTT
ncbi:MAG: ribonuclease III [Alphaproteobacteria bacterium]